MVMSVPAWSRVCGWLREALRISASGKCAAAVLAGVLLLA
jgi:hypothetical protein